MEELSDVFIIESVVDHTAFFARFYESEVTQDAEMLGDGRIGDINDSGQV